MSGDNDEAGAAAGRGGEDATDESRVIADRRKKLEELRGLGVQPVRERLPAHAHDGPGDRQAGRRAEARRGHEEPQPLSDDRFKLAGRIVAHRSFGKATFVKLRDRDGEIQVYVRKDRVAEAAYAAFKRADVRRLHGRVGLLLPHQDRRAHAHGRARSCS